MSGSSFERDGYVVVPGFLSGEELPAVREAVAARLRAVEQDAGVACERPHNTLVPLRWDDAVVAAMLGHEGSARRLQELRCATAAVDLRWISGYVSIKEARSPALWWHQDWWCWDHPVSFRPAAAQVALLCYLGETSPENGALRVLPGSHRASAPIHELLPEAHADASNELDLAHPALADLPDQVTLSLRAGDAAVIDYRLLHGTHGNASDARRDCVLLSFAPGWRDLPADVRGHLIRHPAQPADGERLDAAWTGELLPRFDGVPADLPLNRDAPPRFVAPAAASRSSGRPARRSRAGR